MAENEYRQSNNLRQVQSEESRRSQSQSNSTRPQMSYQNHYASARSQTKDFVRAQHPNLHHALPARPSFSLMGNSIHTHGQSYVDPRYYELNPTYEKEDNTPVWGLAKPLPRVVRPGMQRGRDGEEVLEDKRAEREGPGGAEPIPQLGMIDGQRQEAGKDVKDVADIEQKGYGHGRVERGESNTTAQRVLSENSAVDRYGTPKDEINNPMEAWRSRGSSDEEVILLRSMVKMQIWETEGYRGCKKSLLEQLLLLVLCQ